MSDSSKSASGSTSFPGLLFLLFLGLKLGHVIDWSWWAVTSPLWAAAAIGAVGALLLIVLTAATK